MTSIDELLRRFEASGTCAEAEVALDEIAAREPPPDLSLGDLYDELATEAAEVGAYEVAVSCQRKALAHRCDYPRVAEDMLGWFLLKVGRRAEADAHFESLRAERGDHAELELLIGNALMDSGHGTDALATFDRAREIARRDDDKGWVEEALIQRRECRQEMGLDEDEDDRLVSRLRQGAAGRPAAVVSIAWFPRDQHAEALARWPGLDQDLGDPDGYGRTVESRLRFAWA